MDGKYILAIIRFARSNGMDKWSVVDVLDVISVRATYLNFTIEEFLDRCYTPKHK